MHAPEVKAEALALVVAGLNDCEISRRLGIPRRTILDWRRPSYVKKIPVATCPRCWQAAKPMHFTPEDYTELLGLYLGDGCISHGARTTRLRIALDAKYARMNDEIRQMLRRCFPANPVGTQSVHGGTMIYLSVYSRHLPCLLPQHGAGLKHQRKIELEAWQRRLLESAPWGFVRGCIRSDGCAFVNRTNIHRPQPYEYLSYEFSNMSKGIVDLFVAACDLVGVFTRVNCDCRGRSKVRINRRSSVLQMVQHVGLKS
jgi:Homeodomain-like domain